MRLVAPGDTRGIILTDLFMAKKSCVAFLIGEMKT